SRFEFMIGPIVSLSMAVLQGVSIQWTTAPELPIATANNAVVATNTPSGPAVFSFLGLDSTKRWDGIHSRAFRWIVGDSHWSEIASVPGPGRLASTAQAVDDKIYLFGGYTVAEDGTEKSLPNLDIYDPHTGTWNSGEPIPLPVDDAVSGVWQDSLIYLVSGWHDTGNVGEVQFYDPARDEWKRATPISGTPVFGHTGSIIGNTIVYVDGARAGSTGPRFTIEQSSWLGQIDTFDPTRITWRRLNRHPGPPLYRAAAGVMNGLLVFAGGTDNPYNYNGIGYDGKPSAPQRIVFAYDPETDTWFELEPLPTASMDHRGIAVLDDMLVIVGGMGTRQEVLRQTVRGDTKRR
ncbi:MAG: kelch repeat-containing protein, partial [Gemmatimonadales bacterium]